MRVIDVILEKELELLPGWSTACDHRTCDVMGSASKGRKYFRSVNTELSMVEFAISTIGSKYSQLNSLTNYALSQ